MGRMMGLTSLFKTRSDLSSWPWPSCKHPRTHSFRAAPPLVLQHHDSNNVYKTVNSIFFDDSDDITNSSSEEEAEQECADDVIVEGALRTSDRLFFDPGGDTSSILDQDLKKSASTDPATTTATTSKPTGDHSELRGGCAAFIEESVPEEVESRDPYADFRASMEEMVAAHGLRDDWDRLEELLQWYLKANGRRTHGFILGAFVDLLLEIATGVFSSKYSSINATTGCSSSSSCCSSLTSSSLCSCSCSSSSCIKFVVDENDPGEIEEVGTKDDHKGSDDHGVS